MLGKTDARLRSKSRHAFEKAALNLVPQRTYTRKLVEELMERARWASEDIFMMAAGGSCQHSGGPLSQQTITVVLCENKQLHWSSVTTNNYSGPL